MLLQEPAQLHRHVNKMGAVKWVLWRQGNCLLCNCAVVNVAVTTQTVSALQTTQPSRCRHLDLKLKQWKPSPHERQLCY